MESDRVGQQQSSIIHAVHGVATNGNWVLLAQIDIDPSKPPSRTIVDTVDGGLVILAGNMRDIIALRG